MIPFPFPKRPRHVAVVKATRDVTPHMKSITLASEALVGLKPDGAGQGFKLFVPSGPGGQTVARSYTVRRMHPGRGEIDVDFVIHGSGPASTWAERADVGATVELTTPKLGFELDADADWLLLAGDEAALPALLNIHEALPQGLPVLSWIEVGDARDEQTLASAADLRHQWLHRGTRHAGTTTLLEDAVRHATLPPGKGQIWIRGESKAVMQMRARLKERRIDVSSVSTKAYWKLGEANFHDH
jgi:NADPH-dependent ferric siderophore reductase